MSASTKDRANAAEAAAREGGTSRIDYEAEGRAVREKIARLRALRLAKEAAAGHAAEKAPARPRKSVKTRAKVTVSLSEWLAEQDKFGRRN